MNTKISYSVSGAEIITSVDIATEGAFARVQKIRRDGNYTVVAALRAVGYPETYDDEKVTDMQAADEIAVRALAAAVAAVVRDALHPFATAQKDDADA